MLYGEEYRELIVKELLELPRHIEFDTGPDCVEFGSQYNDLTNCAMMMSHTIWFPADFVRHGTAGARDVTPAHLRKVTRYIVPPDEEHKEERVIVYFELAAPGRTNKDMREIFYAYHDRRLALDRRYNEYGKNIATLIAHYLDARDAKKAMDVQHINANGQTTINVGFGAQ